MDRGDRGPGVGPRAEGADLQVGVAGQQAEQFAARVATGPCDRDSCAHVAFASWFGGSAPSSLPMLSEKLCRVARNYANDGAGPGPELDRRFPLVFLRADAEFRLMRG